jgi:hypothetical protein
MVRIVRTLGLTLTCSLNAMIRAGLLFAFWRRIRWDFLVFRVEVLSGGPTFLVQQSTPSQYEGEYRSPSLRCDGLLSGALRILPCAWSVLGCLFRFLGFHAVVSIAAAWLAGGAHAQLTSAINFLHCWRCAELSHMGIKNTDTHNRNGIRFISP